MRLIDADALCEGRASDDPVVIAAKSAPTIEAEPVLHGLWNEEDNERWVCTLCGSWYIVDGNGYMNYCPNCGAKMDGGVEDGRK
jgi:rubrerythrin